MVGYKPQITTALVSGVKNIDEAYRALAHAVIVLAANDYRDEIRHMEKPGARYRKESLVRFFRSPLFVIYSNSNVTGEYIMGELDREYAEEKARKHAGARAK